MNLGNAHRTSGNLAAAIEAHRDAIAIQPELAVARFNLTNALADAGELTAAATHAREVGRIDPVYRNGYYGLGSLLSQIGARDEASAALPRAVENSTDPDCQTAFADALKEAGRFADAVADLQRLQQSVKDGPGRKLRVGLLVREAEQLVAVERDLGRLAENKAEPRTAESPWLTAWVCALKRHDDLAVRLSRKALATDRPANTVPGVKPTSSTSLPSASATGPRRSNGRGSNWTPSHEIRTAVRLAGFGDIAATWPRSETRPAWRPYPLERTEWKKFRKGVDTFGNTRP